MILQREPCRPHGLRASQSSSHTRSAFWIQFREEETKSWRLYASFEFYGEAEACLNQLLLRGIEAKLDGSRECQQAL